MSQGKARFVGTGLILACVCCFPGCDDDSDGTHTPSADTIAPATIGDLSVAQVTDSTAKLRWTAVGDDGHVGTAWTYDLRYATSPLTLTEWSRTTSVAYSDAPMQAGLQEQFTVTGLSPHTLFFRDTGSR